GTDPVIFFESQRIYDIGEQFHEGGVPEGYYEISFGELLSKRRRAFIQKAACFYQKGGELLTKRRRAFNQKAACFYQKGGGLLTKRRRAFTKKAAGFYQKGGGLF
ncbi:MAG: hypothetical protein LBS03_06450, partial [Bacteroidales bacterium]|nr:hypothetical protein [Bacteroidales bacterium]